MNPTDVRGIGSSHMNGRDLDPVSWSIDEFFQYLPQKKTPMTIPTTRRKGTLGEAIG